MLASSLDSHPNIKVGGEILIRSERYGVPRGSIREVIQVSFQKYDGFIHHREVRPNVVWPVIASLDRLNIISLKRSDMLSAFVSMKLANETNVWQVNKSASDLISENIDEWCAKEYEASHQIIIDPSELIRYFSNITMLCTSIDWMLSRCGHNILNVSYESLVSDWDSGTKEILSFLGYPYSELHAATAKQETRSLPDIVRNYEELRRALNRTIWSWQIEN